MPFLTESGVGYANETRACRIQTMLYVVFRIIKSIFQVTRAMFCPPAHKQKQSPGRGEARHIGVGLVTRLTAVHHADTLAVDSKVLTVAFFCPSMPSRRQYSSDDPPAHTATAAVRVRHSR